jgi:serine/threonine-protein kinase
MAKRAHAGGGAEFESNVRFGPFELDFRRGELRKEGRRIRLQEQPFQILRILLESPGEVVSREEIRKRLWPDETVAEFDHRINAALRRLRDALRDSVDNPRYIKTVARQGYRFIGDVEIADHPAPAAPVVVIPENGLTNRPVEEGPPDRSLRRSPRIIVPALLAAIILIVGAGAWYYKWAMRPLAVPLQPLMRLDVNLGNELSPRSDRGGANAILSPDGTRLVYVSQSKLFTRRLDQTNATELPGTEGAWGPFFSPDGQWVAFFGGKGGLTKVSLQGDKVITLCEVKLGGGGSWGEDGNIIAAVDIFGFSRIPSAGGEATPVTELAPGEVVHRWPQVLPGGKAVIFSAYTSMYGLDSATVEVLSLRDGRRKTLVPVGTWGRYLPSGHLVYINKGTLFAVPFDLDRLEVHGTPTPVLEGVAYSAAWGSAEIDFSRTGTLVYRGSRTGSGLVTVQWLDGSGDTRPLLPVPGNYLFPSLSPDGSRLALVSAGDIWVYELGRGSMTRLTFVGGYSDPLWTADGRYILLRAAGGMWWILADGTGQPQLLTQSKNQQFPTSFTADGKRLAFLEITPASGASDVWTVSVESDNSGLRAGKPEVFLQTPFHERMPMISPDGRWMAYQSDESGRYQVYVQGFPDKHGKRQISGDRGGYPAWSRNRHELFFWQNAPHPHLMVAAFEARGDSFVAEKPRVWSEQVPAFFPATKFYDPAPDGKSVVALMRADTPEERHDRVIFLLNFFDELRRRAPSN